jgi:hypothetical protein
LQRYVESEILNHSTLRHPHVVQFREVFLTKNNVSQLLRLQQVPKMCCGLHRVFGHRITQLKQFCWLPCCSSQTQAHHES